MGVDFRISGLERALFEDLLGATDEQLALRRAQRITADERPGFPCRVSLEDAAVGERLILLPFEHHAVDSPYRGVGPILVREHAEQARPDVNQVPESVRTRLLSFRAYDGRGMLVSSDVAPGATLEEVVDRLFAVQSTRYIHIHNAKPGCYNCRVDRVR